VSFPTLLLFCAFFFPFQTFALLRCFFFQLFEPQIQGFWLTTPVTPRFSSSHQFVGHTYFGHANSPLLFLPLPCPFLLSKGRSKPPSSRECTHIETVADPPPPLTQTGVVLRATFSFPFFLRPPGPPYDNYSIRKGVLF